MTRRQFLMAGPAMWATVAALPIVWPEPRVTVTGLEAAQRGWKFEDLIQATYRPDTDCVSIPRSIYMRLTEQRRLAEAAQRRCASSTRGLTV